VRPSDWQNLIVERYERKAAIITSSLGFSEWGGAFPNKLLGAATIDRIQLGYGAKLGCLPCDQLQINH